MQREKKRREEKKRRNLFQFQGQLIVPTYPPNDCEHTTQHKGGLEGMEWNEMKWMDGGFFYFFFSFYFFFFFRVCVVAYR